MQKVEQLLEEEYQKIIDVVSTISGEKEHNVDRWVKMHSRKGEIVLLRKIVIYLLLKSEIYSKSAVGRFLKRDHSTIIHNKTTVEDVLSCVKHPYKEFYTKCIELYSTVEKKDIDHNDPMDVCGKPDYSFSEYFGNTISVIPLPKLTANNTVTNRNKEMSIAKSMFYRNSRIYTLSESGKNATYISELFNLSESNINTIIRNHKKKYTKMA